MNPVTISLPLAQKFFDAYAAAAAKEEVFVTLPTGIERSKLNTAIPSYGDNAERLPEYVAWAFENWDALSSGNDILDKHDFPPTFFFTSDFFLRMFFTKFLRGDKISNKLDANDLGNKRAVNARKEYTEVPDDIELNV